jgi:LuxR family maltose regulon positive regulatory protein
MHPSLDNVNAFWDAALRALRSSGAVPEGHSLADLSPTGETPDAVLPLVHQGLARLPGRVVLVLDDFHLAEDPGLLDQITWIAGAPSSVSLILLTRVVPLLPLHRLRLTGDLLEIASDDLVFDAAAVDAVARREGLELGEAEVASVLDRTEGWPAGVRLAVLHLARGGTTEGFAGTDRSVAEYLLAEVLDRSTEQDRDFLRRTSVCELISADLAAAIVPGHNGQALLELLERRNAFVTALGPERHWFRYHPLLRDLLEHILRRDHPDQHREAHRAAAIWLADHGEPIAALGHATTVADWELFSSIYTRSAGPCLVGPDVARLEPRLRGAVLAGLPTGPEDELVRAGLALVGGQPEAIAAHLDRARTAREGEAHPPRAAAAVLHELLTVAACWSDGNAQGIVGASRAALAALDAAEPFPAAPAYRTIAALNLHHGGLWSGDVTGAKQGFAAVLDQDSVRQVDLAALHARGSLAFAELLTLGLDRASELASDAIALAAARGWSAQPQVRPAHLALAWVRLLRGETAGADATLTAAMAAVPEQLTAAALHVVQAMVAVSRGWPRAAHHAAEQALAMIEGRPVAPFLADELVRLRADLAILDGTLDPATDLAGGGPEPDSPAGAATRARLLLAAGHCSQARELAATVTATGECATLADLVALVDAWLVEALAADRAGQVVGATEALQRAVEVARPYQLVRPFLLTGSQRTPLLLRRLTDGHAHHDPFAADLLARGGERQRRSLEPAPLREPLTGQELVVLMELPTMQSNSEIASELFVSVNTVKTHLKSLYRKLDVTSRRGAVVRARELGLLG